MSHSGRRSAVGAAALFAALWLLAELARGVWFTGFGWGAAGYAHIDGLARFARYVGAYGVAALVAFMASLIAIWLQAPRDAQAPLDAASWLASVAGIMAWTPGTFSESAVSLQVACCRAISPQDEKFQPGTGVLDALRWYGQQMSAATAPLVVAPETAIPLLPQDLPADYWTSLRRASRRVSRPHCSEFRWSMRPAATPIRSSAFGRRRIARPTAAIATTSTTWFRSASSFRRCFAGSPTMMNIPLGDFSRGAVGQASFEWQGQRLAPNICYEDLFGEELAQRFDRSGQAPTIFVNVSNIGWFGNTVAIDQHLNISRMRALEFERPFIRATNTGETAIIDHQRACHHSVCRA